MKTLNMIFLILAFCLAATICHAQNTSSLMISPQTNEIIPPSPSTAQQIRYQSPQPALATGAVNLSIPLYTIEAEGLTIPFSLNYHTSGIKPLDDPLPCGYGWSLVPALKITRIVRGRPDEKFEYWGDRLTDSPVQSEPKLAYACVVVTNQPFGNYDDEISERYDPEKDIFTISMPNGIYKRIYQKQADGSIEYVGGGADDEISVKSDEELRNFYVTDSHGIIYHFGDKYVETPLVTTHDMTYFHTCWGIIDIELPSGRKIQFDWLNYGPSEKMINGGEVHSDFFDPTYDSDYSPAESDKLNLGNQIGIPFSVNGAYGKRISLSSVIFPGGKIEVVYKNKMISEFRIITDSGTVKRKICMIYGDGKTESVFLQSVDISGEGIYRFEYDPQRFEEKNQWYMQDWWGFFNGKGTRKGQSDHCLTPYIKFKGHYRTWTGTYTRPREIGHLDMSVDEVCMQAGILKKIEYPTGGYSTFEYETHRFSPTKVDSKEELDPETDPYLDKGGGLRVTKICTYTGSDDMRPQIREFQYDSVVVTAVPSAATFVSTARAMGTYIDPHLDVFARFFRRFFVSHCSDYMQNHLGEEAIWYSKVTEIFDEGKIVHRFDYNMPVSTEYRTWEKLSPNSLNNIFTQGVVPTSKEIFKYKNGQYYPIETTVFKYEVTSKPAVSNTHIRREICNATPDCVEAPDFINGTYCFFNYTMNPNYEPMMTGRFLNYVENGVIIKGESPYLLTKYQIRLNSDRLKSKTVTRHLENGDFTQTETYEYKPGTSIVTSVVTTTSNDTRTNRVDLTYASSTGSAAEKGMVAANMTGIPVKTKHTFGTDTTTISHDMANFGNRVYLPSKTYQQRGTNEKWLVGEYTYDNYGNITEYKGEDGIPTSYLWGYNSLHPVYKIHGAGYSQVKALNPGSNALNGSAELTDLTPKLAGWLTTKVLWKPLVGIASQRSPDGLTSTYEYDSAGRLVQTAVDGHGPVSAYTYHINENGYNYTTGAVFKSASATATVREVTNYDGLGRESSRLTKSTQQRLTVERAVSLMPIFNYYATLTEYDVMDRPYRQWATVPSSGMHPSAETVAASAKNLYGTDFAYVTTLYEASPAGTVTGSINSGTEWHDNNRRKTVRRLTNATSGDYSCYRLTLNGTTLSRSLYGKGSLLIEETTDEEGHVSMTFTDCAGRTVMTREGTPGNWYDTRYVYNDYGDLLAVLQPMSDQTKTTIQSEWAFTYKYDNRGRCVEKTIPGAVAVRYVYDNGGRLFAEQDGVMASHGEWLLHFYDRFGRDAFSAVTTATASQITAASNNIYTATPPAATSDIANVSGGYSVNGNFSLNLTTLDKALYYDNYDFGGRCSWIQSTVTSPLSAAAVSKSDVRGMQTGSYSEGRVSAVYYDGMSQPCVTLEGKYTQQWPDYGTALIYDYEGKKSTEAKYSLAPTHEAMQRTDFTYFDNGQLKGLTVTQGRDTATAVYTYDETGRVCDITYGGNMKREMAYDVHGWLTSAQFTVPNKFQLLATLPSFTMGRTVHSETLYYADAPAGSVPRFDGKIASRTANGDFTAYIYDNHGRLTSAKSVTMKSISGEIDRDYSTSYTYDKNANLTSIFRKGIVDIIGGETRLFGTHTDLYFNYKGNQITGMTAAGQGADYEGRTGLGTRTPGNRMTYDANGNLNVDETRNIVRIKYNRQNLPTEITFGDGHRQTITYDGFGRKLRTEYSQVPEGMLVSGMVIYEDKHYKLTSTREYVGPYVFTDGKLEYSAFAGGYFDPDKGAMYYVTDWQGNNVAVVSNTGLVAQRTIYYPYGEPTIEPTGQRYLFGGKEREHAGGRNSYDFGARCLTPYGRWGVVDSESESFYPFSPYTYCAGDPVNYIDPDGKWTVYLSSDKTLNNYARHLHQDGEIHVVAHGNPYYILYDKRDPDHPVGITRGIRLKKVIQHNLFDSQRIINRPGIKIVLHSCNTGTTPNDKEKPLGQELSREIPNAIIIAPNGLLKIDSKGRQSVEDENGKERSKDDSWRVFFRGLEFPIRYIQIIKEYLLTQEQLKSNNTNVENDMKNETDERETRK